MELQQSFIWISMIGIISLINLLLLLYLVSRLLWSSKSDPGSEREVIEVNSINEDIQIDNCVLKPVVAGAAENYSVFINSATELRLLKELEKAEENHFYLQKNINLNDLAETLNTNRRYVSYILKKYRNQDFNSYLQFVRISYMLSCIDKEPELLTEKFSILADRFAFASHSKFSAVFKSVTGMSPTEYFRRNHTK
ncbi:AraC family transcriptional regulator [Sphingobacterium ginsenosidimutans]